MPRIAPDVSVAAFLRLAGRARDLRRQSLYRWRLAQPRRRYFRNRDGGQGHVRILLIASRRALAGDCRGCPRAQLACGSSISAAARPPRHVGSRRSMRRSTGFGPAPLASAIGNGNGNGTATAWAGGRQSLWRRPGRRRHGRLRLAHRPDHLDCRERVVAGERHGRRRDSTVPHRRVGRRGRQSARRRSAPSDGRQLAAVRSTRRRVRRAAASRSGATRPPRRRSRRPASCATSRCRGWKRRSPNGKATHRRSTPRC